ncbi:putative transmembrane protein [Rhodopirellula islandica]|uniref:Transmembrane protein n=1 Tax=Rhodopirellula islandica TaxID=595434 RepID=A0A0J1BBQ2_RHOIS|nr:hypothetical protein [Rhodopirellula islandica]KLU03946.1 putative transmembrane protein [Rhodopirellula islandica]
MSLIETIACVVIVGTLATSMVGMMRGSARVTAISLGHEGVSAQGRKALRFVSGRLRDMSNSGQTITSVRSSDVVVSDGLNTRRIRFEVRRAPDGENRSLVMVDPLLGETVCLESSVGSFAMNEILVDGRLAGIQLSMQLQASDDRAAELRPDHRTAEMTTVLCLSPQL